MIPAAGEYPGREWNGKQLAGCWPSCQQPQALLVWLFIMVLLPPPHQVGHDVLLHDGDVGAMVPAHDRHALGAHQELLKVPLDVMVPQRLPEELVGVPKLLRHRGTGVLQWGASASLPCPSKKQAGCVPLISPCHSTHLQEGEDLLLLGPVHIPFLEQLEVGNKATTWPDVPTRWGTGCCAMDSSGCLHRGGGRAPTPLFGGRSQQQLQPVLPSPGWDPSRAEGIRCPTAPTTVLT